MTALVLILLRKHIMSKIVHFSNASIKNLSRDFFQAAINIFVNLFSHVVKNVLDISTLFSKTMTQRMLLIHMVSFFGVFTNIFSLTLTTFFSLTEMTSFCM